MSGTREQDAALAGVQRIALSAGAVALLLAGVGAVTSPGQFFRSYLVAFLFWLGPTVGSMALLLLHHLTGGAWGDAIQRFLRAGARLVPLIALMFLPLLLGLRDIYAWTWTERVAGDPLLEQKTPYLNVPFFVTRAAVYFLLWTALAYTATARGKSTPDMGVAGRSSAPWLIVLALTMAFAAVDWSMSVDPRWFSSIYPLVVIMGQMLQALMVAIIAATWFHHRWQDHRERLTPARFNDLGNLSLAFVMLWAYLALSEYLVIWSGDLPADVTWYVRRTASGWRFVGIAVVVLHFAFPFMILLSRKAKRTAPALAWVAALILLARLVGIDWLVQPGFYPSLRFHWLDLVLPVGLGGLWVGAFAASLRGQAPPAVPVAIPVPGEGG